MILKRKYFFSKKMCIVTEYAALMPFYSGKVHDIHKYNVKIIGPDSKPVAYLDHLLDIL